MAESADGLPVIATVQPKATVLASPTQKAQEYTLPRSTEGGKQTESTVYGIFLYSLVNWKIMHP